jgi:flagellar basal-body rod modification protein FlgD
MTTAIPGVSGATPPQASNATTASTQVAATNQLSYNDFLTLLMSELQHQDPTQPMDPTQMVSQLATVSNVGQAVQANKTLSQMLTANSLSQAEGMLGQTITSTDGKSSGTVSSVTVSSGGSTATLANGDKVDLSTGATIQ